MADVPTLSDPLVAVMRDAPRCPYSAAYTIDHCRGLDGCAMCLRLAAAAVREHLRRELSARLPLTPQQRHILTYIAARFRVDGYAPTFDEIAQQFGFSSLATVAEHIGNLRRKGYVQTQYQQPRSITLVGAS